MSSRHTTSDAPETDEQIIDRLERYYASLDYQAERDRIAAAFAPRSQQAQRQPQADREVAR